MTYVDCFMAAVPSGNKDLSNEHARKDGTIFKEHGALKMVDMLG